ncbi:uncharacterized protein K489DRAFT_383454 [Dissoconium aciculare CBS 342.82]|uniref:Pathway-specific nitrogen regulator n=1 Tax=Dissoconium aciculare CBS 342.82 TaxID=1314786 RepID=A0A6J3LVW0_9PEZI|nr:uncharacterized protein K489DRAFT_383454 [Dissoconium aciculare CBS 342.82]KAF1819900.1 hypothetical protein K489DRAFT_383454 [Dissoconium aciculare CBS 342.82]
MARQTKAPRFTIYEDVAGATGTTTKPTKIPRSAAPPPPHIEPSDPDHRGPTDELSRVATLKHNATPSIPDDEYSVEDFAAGDDTLVEPYERTDSPLSGVQGDEDGDLHNARRASILTSTSISSFPESSYDVDHDDRTTPLHHPYSPQSVRAAFRRPSSVRRMQMTSPTPFERSPRRSVLHQTRSRPGTPRSAPPSSIKGSPKPRRLPEEDDESRDYPLVLLHVTLLPADIRWSPEVLRRLLPQNILDNLELLRCKISETVAQRGILIQHPKGEYELLEERLLQSLELSKERVTKCGHFRARDSVSSAVSSVSSVKDSDSAIGSDIETCSTCHQHMKPAQSGAAGEKVWAVKIFAANGLLGPSAWAAAWSDMERVDVEIFPWIDADLRKQLDAAQTEADAAQDLLNEQEESRIRAILEEQARTAGEGRGPTSSDFALDPPAADPDRHLSPSPAHASSSDPNNTTPRRKPRLSLPEIYRRPADIPLSILLRNYLFLLAQDRKNVIIFVLGVLVLYLGLLSGGSSSAASRLSPIATGALEVPAMYDVDLVATAAGAAASPVLTPATNATVELFSDDAGKTGAMSSPSDDSDGEAESSAAAAAADGDEVPGTDARAS